MNARLGRFLLTATLTCTASTASSATLPPFRAAHALVTADNTAASEAGAEMLRRGGDAVDAAVATALMLGVVQPFASGLGGGGFAVVHRADGTPEYTLDFREVAPAMATATMFQDARGEVVPGASTRGPRAAGVPGELAGLFRLHQRHGKLPWGTVVQPALKAARDGFPAGDLLVTRITRMLDDLRRSPGLAADFLQKDGTPVAARELVRRPDLARTLAEIARGGADTFYRGPLAKRIAEAVAQNNGLVTAADLAAYAPIERPPLSITWRGLRIVSMAPPSSGGAVILQVLRVLEPVDLAALGHNSSRYLHRLTEALKHAFADRAAIMGDPAFTPVPVDTMLAEPAVDRVRQRTEPFRVQLSSSYGGGYTLPTDHGTSHLNVVDAAGNAVALTTTVNTSFGSLYVAGDTGVLLNNEMDDFVARPGVPNAFGLVGREANAVAPGKRPLSSMSPTLVLKDGKVVLAVGASGGPTIITGTLQVLLDVLVFGLDPQAAVEASRMHHQWSPETLVVESDLPADVVQALEGRGHKLIRETRYNAVQVIQWTPAGLLGACDPSKLGQPAGY